MLAGAHSARVPASVGFSSHAPDTQVGLSPVRHGEADVENFVTVFHISKHYFFLFFFFLKNLIRPKYTEFPW